MYTDLETMHWQLHDIDKMITNNILPSSLSCRVIQIFQSTSPG